MTSQQKFSAAVVIGRFQALHDGQLALIRRALAQAPLCVVVIGSAHQARTPKNPFTWEERAEVIRLAVGAADGERLRFVPVRDYYDSSRWVAAVREGVGVIAGNAPMVLVGHLKDATSVYLREFPGWTLDDAGSQGPMHSSAVRDVWFGAEGASLDAALAALVDQVPPATLAFLRSWSALPYYSELASEWRALRDEKAKWAGSPYPPVFVTVDAVVKCSGTVLLIRRGRAPGKGLFAVPGGFIEQRETVLQSALRELEEETGLKLLEPDMRNALKDTQVFDHPDRSQRGRVITHAHLFDLGNRRPPEVNAADDAASAEWMPIDRLAGLEDRFHDDHFHILDYFFSLTAQ